MTRVVLVRHGETEWNSARRLQGQRDISLSAAGRSRVEDLAQMIAGFRAERVWSSPLRRARESAAALGFDDPAVDDRLMEASLGEWEGELSAEIAAAPGSRYRDWRAGRFTPPGGESFEQLRARVVAALNDIAGAGQGTVLVVTHGGVVRAALDGLCAISPTQIVPADSPSVTVLDRSDEGRWRLASFNLAPAPPDDDPSD